MPVIVKRMTNVLKYALPLQKIVTDCRICLPRFCIAERVEILLLIRYICFAGPSNLTYPSQQYPLVLFKNTNFEGAATHVKPDEFKEFAANRRYARETSFNSLRVLFNRTIIFARNVVFPTNFYNGNDIEDITEFMKANSDVANKIWFNYESSHEAGFQVKVGGNARCDNCSSTNGVCYTGFCNCMSGFTGQNCDSAV